MHKAVYSVITFLTLDLFTRLSRTTTRAFYFTNALLSTGYYVDWIYKHGQTSMAGLGQLGGRFGFDLTDATRPRLIFALNDAIRLGAIVIRSSIVQEQLLAFERRPDGKLNAGSNACVWAAALAALGLEIAPKPHSGIRRPKGFDALGAKRKRRPDYYD